MIIADFLQLNFVRLRLVARKDSTGGSLGPLVTGGEAQGGVPQVTSDRRRVPVLRREFSKGKGVEGEEL